MSSLSPILVDWVTDCLEFLRGDEWHRLRHNHFEQVDFSECSDELVQLLKGMMQSDPAQRVDAAEVYSNPIISQARVAMEVARGRLGPSIKASALAGEPEGWLDEILARVVIWDPKVSMDLSP